MREVKGICIKCGMKNKCGLTHELEKCRIFYKEEIKNYKNNCPCLRCLVSIKCFQWCEDRIKYSTKFFNLYKISHFNKRNE